MNGELFHMATVAAYGNNYINNKSENINYPCNSTYIKNVQFLKSKKGFVFMQKLLGTSSEKVVSESVEGWFKHLRNNKCMGIELLLDGSKKDNHLLNAYANGVRGWYIICRNKNITEIWMRNWDLEKSKEDTKWNVYYHSTIGNMDSKKVSIGDLIDLKNKYDNILERIGIFQLKLDLQLGKIISIEEEKL